MRVMLGVCIFVVSAACAYAQPAPPCEKDSCPSGWLQFDAKQRERIFAFAEDYKAFMHVARTARTAVREAERRARAAGFQPWQAGAQLRPGSRWYVNNRGQALALFVIGKRPLLDGLRIIAAHVDSPHLDLKGQPLYEAEGFGLLQTNFHGSILNFQWGNTPLALIGQISRKDGSSIELSVGLAPEDPVFMIAGLSPHVDKDLRERTYREALEAEELDPIVGSMPLGAEKGAGVKAQVMQYLQERYAIELADFVSADLALVPAASPRDVGFDRAMMTMYGQDDRLGAYVALHEVLALRGPEHTAVAFLANNEEVGNVNNSGAGSDFLTDLLQELLYAQLGESLRTPHATRALRASKVLSLDVNDGINPTWPLAWEIGNAPRIGRGVNFKLYGKGTNAPPEYAAWVRRVFDEAGVQWQTATYKVGPAGGGTLGGELSRRNMDVIDVGVPVMSIHHIYDLSSKVDLWWLARAAGAFWSAP